MQLLVWCESWIAITMSPRGKIAFHVSIPKSSKVMCHMGSLQIKTKNFVVQACLRKRKRQHGQFRS